MSFFQGFEFSRVSCFQSKCPVSVLFIKVFLFQGVHICKIMHSICPHFFLFASGGGRRGIGYLSPRVTS